VLTGGFDGTVDLDPSGLVDSWTAAGADDAYVVKLDRLGAWQWSKVLGGSGSDRGTAVGVFPDDAVAVAGMHSGGLNLGSGWSAIAGAGGSDGVVAKIDASGALLWAKGVGGAGTDAFTGIGVGRDGSVRLAGGFDAAVAFTEAAVDPLATLGGTAGALVRIESTNVRYADVRPTGLGFVQSMLVGGSVAVDDLAVASDGSLTLAGKFQGTIDLDPGPGVTSATALGGWDAYVAHYTAARELVWGFALSGTGSEGVTKVHVNDDGSLTVVGTITSAVDFDPGAASATLTPVAGATYVARYTAAGEYVFAYLIGTAASVTVNDVAFAPDDALVMVGTMSSGTSDFDPSAATYNLTTPSLSTAMFLAKYTADGGFIYAKRMGGSGSFQFAMASSVSLLPDGGVYLGGYFQGPIDADPGAGTANLTSSGGSYDALVARYDMNGGYIWAITFGGSGTDDISSVRALPDSSVLAVGKFRGTTDFDPGAGSTSLGIVGTEDYFIARYSSTGTLAWVGSFGGTGNDVIAGVELLPSGGFAIGGGFCGTVDFDIGGLSNTRTSNGASEIYYATYGLDGALQSVRTLGGSGFASGARILRLPDASLLIAGQLRQGGSTFGAGEPNETTISTATAVYEGYLMRVFGGP
jgi:hypothetical protein